MMKYLLSIFAFLLLVSTACSDSDGSPFSDDELLIRVINVSDSDYKNVIINSENFGDLDADERSEYRSFEMAYSYSYVSLEIDGETFVQQPIDYVGETPLSNGKYSYLIDVASIENRRLIQTLVKDD